MTKFGESEADRIWREKLGQTGSPRSSVAALAISLSGLLVLFVWSVS